MNTRRNTKGVITASTHQNATAKMAQRYSDMTIAAARTVSKGVFDIEENQFWDWVTIHALPSV
jgi:hypothetical protein